MKPELTQEILKEFLDYDPETGALLWKTRDRKWFANDNAFHGWNTKCAGKEAFTATRSEGYKVGRIFNRPLRAHRVLYCLHFGYFPDSIDHINGNPADNRISNLRDVTHAVNHRNRRLQSNSSSGVYGVRWSKEHERWRARINVDGKEVHIGYYPTKDGAVLARKQAEAKYGFHPNHGRLTNAH